jgi:hypothetical protein
MLSAAVVLHQAEPGHRSGDSRQLDCSLFRAPRVPAARRQQWTPAISRLALAIAACAWLPKNIEAGLSPRSGSRLKRALFRIGMFFALLAHRLRGRALATNVVFTPQQTSHGTVSLDATAAIATKNYVVCRGADDRHFKVGTLVTTCRSAFAERRSDLGEVDVVKKEHRALRPLSRIAPGCRSRRDRGRRRAGDRSRHAWPRENASGRIRHLPRHRPQPFHGGRRGRSRIHRALRAAHRRRPLTPDPNEFSNLEKNYDQS